MKKSSFTESFLLVSLWGYFFFRIFYRAFPNVLSQIPQKQWFETPHSKEWLSLWDEYKHHKRVAQKASLQFSMEEISLLDRVLRFPLNISSQNSQRPTFILGNVEEDLTLWKEWTCQRVVSSSASFCFLLADISLFAIVFNVLWISLFWFYRNSVQTMPSEKKVTNPWVECSHHGAVSQNASLQFLSHYISYFTTGPNVIPYILSWIHPWGNFQAA